MRARKNHLVKAHLWKMVVLNLFKQPYTLPIYLGLSQIVSIHEIQYNTIQYHTIHYDYKYEIYNR